MDEERRRATGQGQESYALAVLDKRLAKVNQITESLGLKKNRGPSVTNSRGYREGVERGKTVHIGGKAKGALSGAKKELR